MGQFDRYVENGNPSPAMVRVFSIVVPIGLVINAVGSHRLEDIMSAVLAVALILPMGIAPRFTRARAAFLDRRPIVSVVFMLLLVGCGFFVLLTPFFGRSTRVLIAVPLAVVLTVTSHVLRRRRA